MWKRSKCDAYDDNLLVTEQEQAWKGGNYIVDEVYICRDCKLFNSSCGDGYVDPLRGEMCDNLWSQGGGVDEEGRFCNDECQYDYVVECMMAQGNIIELKLKIMRTKSENLGGGMVNSRGTYENLSALL
eukprot:Awhi_evm1s9523